MRVIRVFRTVLQGQKSAHANYVDQNIPRQA